MKLSTLFFATVVITSTSTGALANVKQCTTFLSPTISSETNFAQRNEIFNVAQEIRASKTTFRLPFISWKKRAVLRSDYAMNTLIRAYSKLERQIKNSNRTRIEVMHSADELLNFTNQLIQNFPKDGIRYDWFQKLSFFFAVHIDMLTFPDMLANRDLSYLYGPGVALDYNTKFAILMRNKDDILNSLNIDNYYLVRTNSDSWISRTLSLDFSRHYTKHDASIVIPTTSDLDLESIYWLRARGIGVMKVGEFSAKTPSEGFSRDFSNASGYYNRITTQGTILSTDEDIKRTVEFYSEVEERISSNSNSKRERLIKLSLAYYFLTGNKLVFDHCESIESFYNQAISGLNNKNRHFSQFNLSRDLVLAPPTLSEVKKGLLDVKNILLSVCK